MISSTRYLHEAIQLRPTNQQNEARRMGVEIEFAGISAESIVEAITECFGGQANWLSPFEVVLEGTDLGLFKVELDSKRIKKLGKDSDIQGNPSNSKPSMERTYIETVSSVAESIVPWEVVTPPIEFTSLERLIPLIIRLRSLGAKGTKSQLHYAFGVHLNPELVDLEAHTIVNYLKSFFCLYEWIKRIDGTDATRRITPYINHFGQEYIVKVLDPDYKPDRRQMMIDYLESNATRNRSLDLLPLFAHIDKDLLAQYVTDDRVNARPTFHYRFPNCDIDNPEWNLDTTIECWMTVEHLAYSSSLQSVCDEYLSKLDSLLPVMGASWNDRLTEIVSATSSIKPATKQN